MIVLKSTQDKVLAILQSVAGIVAQRHARPLLAKIIIQKSGVNSTALKLIVSNAYPFTGLRAARHWAISALPRCIGFFSANKANLRNAP